MTLKMLDTFAGIGGFSYAAKYLIDPGIETTGFVEIDPFCQKILSKNFPKIKKGIANKAKLSNPVAIR